MATALHDETMNIPCEPIEGAESEVLTLHEMVDQHRKNTADAYGEAMDDHAVKVMPGIDEEPASLSKAMAFLESKEVQMRREQKLRDEVAALTAKVDQLQRLNAIRYNEAMEAASMATAFRDGNTALIEALMGMASQFFNEGEDESIMPNLFTSTEEGAIEALEDAGFAEEVEQGRYKLRWDKLAERKARE
jgi:hypothetical protein